MEGLLHIRIEPRDRARPGIPVEKGDDRSVQRRFDVQMATNFCRVIVSVQEMTVEAALTGNRQMANLAVLNDPLTAAVCTPSEVWAMVDEMFEALATWLPQF